MSLIRRPSSTNRFLGMPFASANTTARPRGCPQSKALTEVSIAGRCGASPPIPRISNPFSKTRSPCGPHANGPASSTGKRQTRSPSSGSRPHARPSATKATVKDAPAPPHAPGGKRRAVGQASAGDDDGRRRGRFPGSGGGGVSSTEGCVHAPSSRIDVRTNRIHRIVLSTVHLGPRAGEHSLQVAAHSPELREEPLVEGGPQVLRRRRTRPCPASLRSRAPPSGRGASATARRSRHGRARLPRRRTALFVPAPSPPSEADRRSSSSAGMAKPFDSKSAQKPSQRVGSVEPAPETIPLLRRSREVPEEPLVLQPADELHLAELGGLEPRRRRQVVAEGEEVLGRHRLEDLDVLDQHTLDRVDARQIVTRALGIPGEERDRGPTPARTAAA